MLNITHHALEKFDNPHDFERMAGDILNALGYKNVTPIGPRGGPDDGKDITYKTYDGQKGLACVSLRKDAKIKILNDLQKHKKGDYSEYTFFTNQYLTPTDKKEVAKYCIETLDAEFIPRDIEAVRSLLDTTFQDIRKSYLKISKDSTPTYTLRVDKIVKFSIQHRLNEASDWLEHEQGKFDFEREARSPWDITLPKIDMISKPAEEMLADIKEYIGDLTRFERDLDKMLSFNIEVISSLPDTHVEVHVSPSDEKFSLAMDILDAIPTRPSYNRMYVGDIAVATRKDENEFYAAESNDGVSIKSNLEVINPFHPKLLFHERVYIVPDDGVAVFKVRVTIYTRGMPQPLVQTLDINSAEATVLEV